MLQGERVLVQDVARHLQSLRAACDWHCPISQERISSGVLASDGRIYEREDLRAWLEQCRKRREPYSSPVTREALRPTVCTLQSVSEAILCGETGKVPDVVLVPFQREPSDVALKRSGSARCRHWNSRLGVVTRMLLGWNDDDTIEWWFPISKEASQSAFSIFTPKTALPQSLKPVAEEMVGWLGLQDMIPDPMDVFTMYACSGVGVSSATSPPATVEEMLLRG